MRLPCLRPALATTLVLAGSACFGSATGPADTTPPVIVITSPASGTVSGTVPFTATVLDDTGVANVVFKVDDKTLFEDPLPPYETTWATNGTKNGDHVVSVTAVDITGKSTTVAKSVTVANGPA